LPFFRAKRALPGALLPLLWQRTLPLLLSLL
jgi:hypothetical protein